MNVIPFVHEGLGNSSYLVDLGEGRALLVDPDRTAARYLALAESRRLRIEAVLETHLHADFVSGACEIAAAVDAGLYLPRAGGVQFPHVPVDAGAAIRMDGIEVAKRLRLTPWGRKARLFALTGMGQQADIARTRAAGFDEHLTKPADLQRVSRLAAGETATA